MYGYLSFSFARDWLLLGCFNATNVGEELMPGVEYVVWMIVHVYARKVGLPYEEVPGVGDEDFGIESSNCTNPNWKVWH